MCEPSDMTYRLCPDGVEYKKLGKIAEYCKKRVDVSEVNAHNYVGVANLLPDKQGKTDSLHVPRNGRVIQYRRGDILIGNIGAYLKKIWLAEYDGGTNGDVLALHITDNSITPEFLYYCLSSDNFFAYDVQHSQGSIMPRGSKTAVMEYKIPIPPLHVQEEIVRILDKFTELVKELTKELELRKKQYAYYRDKLLTFDESVSRKTLSEVCNIYVGGDAPKGAMSKEKTDEYTIPIISNGVGENAFYGYTDAAKITEPAVTVAARGTIGYAEYRDYPYFPIVRLISLIPKDTLQLETRYLYYCLQDKKYNVPIGGIPQLTVPMLKKIEIPIPLLDIQMRIADTLDKFDRLCNDLTYGIPGEIKLRRRQYEYYRDKLLTFKPLQP